MRIRKASSYPRGRRRRVGLALASLVALALVPAAASASAAPAKKLSLLQQGLNFYRGQTITIISPDAPGGGYDVTTRAIAPYVAQYLQATVDVVNDAPANSIAGQDLFMSKPPDGLTIGMVNMNGDIENEVTGSPGVNFNPQRTQFLGGNNPSGGGFSCLASSPYQSFAQVVHSTTPVTETVVSSGVLTLQMDLINAAFNINAKVIGGYTSTSLLVAGFERGDGFCGPFSISTAGVGPYLASGKAHQLLTLGPSNPATAFYSVAATAPSVQEAFKEFPAKTITEQRARAALLAIQGHIGHEWNVQPGVANYKVTALRAAVKAALTNVKCEDLLLSAGQQNGFVSPGRALAAYKVTYTALKKVAPLIKTALGV